MRSLFSSKKREKEDCDQKFKRVMSQMSSYYGFQENFKVGKDINNKEK